MMMMLTIKMKSQSKKNEIIENKNLINSYEIIKNSEIIKKRDVIINKFVECSCLNYDEAE